MFPLRVGLIPLLMLIGALLSVVLAAKAWSGSKKESARPFALLELSLFLWCLFSYLRVRVSVPEDQFFYFRLGCIGILSAPTLAFLFGRALEGRPFPRGKAWLLAIFPALTFMLQWRSDLTPLYWTANYRAGSLVLEVGPWFWLNAIYSFFFLGLLFVSCARNIRASVGIERNWLVNVFAFFVLPSAVNAFELVLMIVETRGFPATPAVLPIMDPTPIAFAISSLLIFLSLRRYNILDDVPFAKDTIFESIRDPILVLDSDGRIVGSNREAQNLFHSKMGLENRNIAELSPPVGAVIENGGGVEWDFGDRVFSVFVHPMRGRPKTWSGSIAIYYDITEQSRALKTLGDREEALRRYAFMVNASRDFMSIVNRDLCYEAVNEAFCESYGKCRDDVVGLSVAEVWKGTPINERLLPGFESCFRGNYTVVRMRYDFGDGRGNRDLEFSFNPFRSSTGEVSHAVLVTKDVTDYLETQRQLSAARERADAANEAKGTFLASMSHEIRTPMNAIIGLTELTLRAGLSGEQRDNLETVLSSAHGLLDLINDILDLSKIEAGRMTLERIDFDLPERIASILRTFRVVAEAKGLSLDLVVENGVPRYVAGDPLKLGQIVMNLVGNAIKFTEKGRVTVTISSLPLGAKPNAQRKGAGPTMGQRPIGIEISVKDTGIGIAPEKQQLIFESFSQADNSVSRRFGGTGLGLSICKMLAGLFGGDIWVASTPGAGSTFSFTAFFDAGDPGRVVDVSHIAPSSAPGGKQHLSILVVEDNPVNAKVALRWLENEGHRAMYASSGLDAIAALGKERFDLVLLDIEMPDMDGIEVAKRVRAGGAPGPSGSLVPIVAMTAHSGNEARKACAAAGMDDYVTKPVDFAELSATLARVARPVTREFPAGAGSSASKPPSSAGDSLGLIQPAEPLRRLGGDEPLFLEVLSIFAAESAGRRAAFEAARDGRDVESLRRLAHALRGSAKTVGAESLALRATELETLAGGTARMAPVGKASPVPEFSEGISLAVTALLALLESTVEAARAILPPGYVAPTDDI